MISMMLSFLLAGQILWLSLISFLYSKKLAHLGFKQELICFIIRVHLKKKKKLARGSGVQKLHWNEFELIVV